VTPELLPSVPLGLLGAVRWTTWLLRRVPAALYRPFVADVDLPMTVVVPVYQEDPEVLRRALATWRQEGVAEVLLVVDATDAACLAVAHASQECDGVAHASQECDAEGSASGADVPVRVLVTPVPGKRHALRAGWEAARTPLVALVDSDTSWAPDAARQLRMPFADPTVGGASARQNVDRPSGLLQRVNDMYLDYRYFDELAGQTVAGRSVSCLSGRTAVYRRSILARVADDFIGETFLGVPCMSGDDKRLTSLAAMLGYATVLQRSARVWSTFPGTPRTFVRQRVRWARNTWRSDLRALFLDRWVWRRPFLAFCMADKAVGAFTLLAGPVYLVMALGHGDLAFAAALLGWWWFSRALRILPHLRRRPSSVLLVPVFVAVTFVMAVLKLWALLTVRRQRWLTRDVAVVDGAVVRTGPAALATRALQPAGVSS
jgi:cellulose synthase/poly-beta-1,6-N-acetylglucosamine synthase-like glycosyltransferase